MIREDYVTFEQAKALKEIGFPQDLYYGSYFYDENGKQFLFNGVPLLIPKYICPPQSLVQKWFIQEYKLHICLDYLTNEVYSVCVCTPDYAHDSDIIYDIEGTYEHTEGLSTGIDKCIELLKEKKNGK